MRLYEIADEYRRVAELIDDAGGELSPELEAAFDAANGSLAKKADAIAALVREAEAEAAAYAGEAGRLAAAKRAAENRAVRLKNYLLDAMDAAGVEKVKGPRFTPAVRLAARPSIRWDGPGEPPDGFVVLVRQFDAGAAWEAYKSGTLPDGFSAKRTRYLEIR